MRRKSVPAFLLIAEAFSLALIVLGGFVLPRPASYIVLLFGIVGIGAITYQGLKMIAREIDSLRGQFVSAVSHQLKSPLTVIEGYIEYLLEGMDGKIEREKQIKALRLMKQNAQRLEEMVDNLLDLARIRLGQLSMKKQPIKIEEVLKEKVDEFAALARRKHIAIEIKANENIDAALGDKEKVGKVVRNLLSNAIKFNRPSGKIIVEAKQGSSFIEISVRDTGYGLEQTDLSQLLNELGSVRMQGGERREGDEGYALGLAVAKGMVEVQGGKMWAETEIGKGSKFIFTLPRAHTQSFSTQVKERREYFGEQKDSCGGR